MRIKSSLKKHYLKVFVGIFLIWFLFFSLPQPLFTYSTSTILYSAENQLLGATIAEDEQWRFPYNDSIPEKFKICITEFEDTHFYHHFGVNPISLLRAFKQNIISGKVISGGSTLTMQTIRLAKHNPKRTIWEKCKEIVQATRLECTNSKNSILAMYCSNAPFGSNVVGLDAASWRYYGKNPDELTWAECATLAVLPNAPSLIYPGKNQEKLLLKRNKLLTKLKAEKSISEEEYQLSLTEPLPNKPFPLPNNAYHLVQNASKQFKGQRLKTSIKLQYQEKLNQIVQYHHTMLQASEIQNICAIIVEIKTGNVLAYVGNAKDQTQAKAVNIIQAKRSSGSILKPFLYAKMIENGTLLPQQLISDVPSDITENFDGTYSGMVNADEALAKSLNIPAIKELNIYGVNTFYNELKKLEFSTLNQNASHYGLSLIVGGAEIKLWDLVRAYRNMAYKLQYAENDDEFSTQIQYFPSEEQKAKFSFNPNAIYLTFKAMQKVNRPTTELGWQVFGRNDIAWKTGTSHGFKDAWSVGISSEFVVGVWVGNASGEGRPGIVGVKAAAPVLFDVFNFLPKSSAFKIPKDQWKKVTTCAVSGFLANENCPIKKDIFIPKEAFPKQVCKFHKIIHLDESEQYRVNSNCYQIAKMKTKVWFTLPALEESYYQTKHPEYKPLPPFSPKCMSESYSLAFIYPRQFNKMFLPKDAQGNVQAIVFQATISDSNAELLWYLDDNFIGKTSFPHKIPVNTDKGKHTIMVLHNSGISLRKSFEVIK